MGRAAGRDQAADRLGQRGRQERRAAPTPPASRVSFRPILGPTEELAWERAHRILEATKENVAAFRAQWGAKSFGLGGGNPENVGSQRLLAAVAKGELHDRALWTPLAAATGAGGNSTALVGTPETVAQAILDYVDIGVTTILIRGYDPYDDAIDYGRQLLPLVREEVARRDAEKDAPRSRREREPRQAGQRGMSARQRQLKLGAVSHGVGGPGSPYLWLDEDFPVDASVNINWYIELARRAEEAKFDLVFIVDSQFITADSPPHYLNRLEPITLLSALAVSTTHIGLVATMTTSYNDPFNLARRLASLDLISGGRSGWNVVTSGDAGRGGELLPRRALRLRHPLRPRAWSSSGSPRACGTPTRQDAFPRDRATRTFLDPTRQHALNHRGEHFQVQGPLNVSRSPQGQPVIFQAGDSEQGRDLGATIGEGIFTFAPNIEQAQAFYADLKARAAAKGRSPDEIVIMPGRLGLRRRHRRRGARDRA